MQINILYKFDNIKKDNKAWKKYFISTMSEKKKNEIKLEIKKA